MVLYNTMDDLVTAVAASSVRRNEEQTTDQ